MNIPLNGKNNKMFRVPKMTKEQMNKGSLALVKLIMLCEAFQTFNEELSETSQYRLNIKGLSNKLKKESEEVLRKNLDTVWKTEEELYVNLSRNLESFMDILPKCVLNMKPEEFLELNQLILMYLENKPTFRKNFEFTMIEINSGNLEE